MQRCSNTKKGRSTAVNPTNRNQAEKNRKQTRKNQTGFLNDVFIKDQISQQ